LLVNFCICEKLIMVFSGTHSGTLYLVITVSDCRLETLKIPCSFIRTIS